MDKFKLVNGWTKERALRVIKKGNNGQKAAYGGICRYISSDGNKCFAGCFIPNGHPAQDTSTNLFDAVDSFPEVAHMMPLATDEMIALQRAHDFFDEDSHPEYYARFPELLKATNEHEVAQIFFDNYVEEAP